MIKLKRTSGVLLHITSLPGPYGIGEIGPQAFNFVDDLADMKQKLWQILPDNPTDNYNCPYGAISAFANNSLLISFDYLLRDGWLDQNDLNEFPNTNSNQISFEEIKNFRYPLLEKASQVFQIRKTNEDEKKFKNFCKKNKYWLENYALFIVLQKILKEEEWIRWPSSIKFREAKALNTIIIKYKKEIKEEKILQYLYYSQWSDLKNYANKKNIKIIGDIPIYVSFNSVDVWVNQKLFKLNEDGEMLVQSGCPPDFFISTGQIWGHPIYNWEEHKKNDYNWWLNRILFLFKKVDIIRVDHFNGFAKYWEIPSEDKNGLNGQWVEGPGRELLDIIFKEIDGQVILAEDLGEAYDEAKKLRNIFGIPGMKILQFSFGDGKPLENMDSNTVLYTGTHDNNTSLGWYNEKPGISNTDSIKNHIKSRNKAKIYLGLDESIEVPWSMIRYVMNSDAYFCIIPLQDILGLDSSARMNTPGTIGDNWVWRYEKKSLNTTIKKQFKKITEDTNRI